MILTNYAFYFFFAMFRLLDLPRDLLLHLLLHHFTLQEVIQFRCLCHELYDLVHYCLSRRRSLKLFFSFADVQAYTQNQLYEHNLESDPVLRLHPCGPSSDELIIDQHKFLNPLVDLLVDRLFPNVTHLIILFRFNIRRESLADNVRAGYLIEDNVTYLITRMCTRLTGLSLFGAIRSGAIGQRIARRLLHSINQNQNLRRLDLCVEYLSLYFYTEYCVDNEGIERVQKEHTPPILVLEPKLLNKLERISVLFNRSGLNFCQHSFRHLGPNLTRLVMHQQYASQFFYLPEPLLCRSLIGNAISHSTSSITHLKLTQHLSALLPKVLPRFTGLKSLDLVNFTFSKTETKISCLELFGLLAQFCPHLIELKLFKFNLGWVRQAEQNSCLPQLKHLTSLALKCVHQNDQYDPAIKPEDQNIPFDKFINTFDYIMPNLERFNLKIEKDFFDDLNKIKTERLRMLTICYISKIYLTSQHLLSVQYRKRFIREWAERRLKLKNNEN